MKINTKLNRFLFSGLLLIGCHDKFLERPPYDALPAGSYYKTDAQIRASGGYLYARTWFDFTDKVTSGLELLAGNGMTYSPDVNRFSDFSLTADYTQVIYPWRSFYNTIGNANVLISDLAAIKPSSEVTQKIILSVTGEARFIRALAYFYLVQLWGPVPIITDNKIQITDPFVPKAPVADVYRFIKEDLEYAEQNCLSVDVGRVTSYSAKALLAKVYLTRASINKSNGDYAKAANYAKEVMDNGPYSLLPNYADLWFTKNDNNAESIFALQCVACANSWGNQNSLQAYFAYDGSIAGVGDGWDMMRPSIDLLNAYEVGDLRRKPTVMEEGNKYPEIHSKSGGLTYTKKRPDNSLRSPTGANIKKFVVGAPEDDAVCYMSTGLNVPMLRFADVLLTYAEAKIGLNTSTSDANAVASFNKIRTRAGLPGKASIAFTDVLHERRMEFAIEFQYWFDLLRYHNLDPAGAIAHLGTQNRKGFIYFYDAKEFILALSVSPAEKDFLFPIPANDASANPKLLEEPVPYYKN
jgi:starch-binding outer membrane protein, SusD/RagB family